MGGEIKWEALEFIADMLGIQDVEALVHDMVSIRDWRDSQRD